MKLSFEFKGLSIEVTFYWNNLSRELHIDFMDVSLAGEDFWYNLSDNFQTVLEEEALERGNNEFNTMRGVLN